MSEMDNFLTALDSLELTPEQKAALSGPVKAINTEKGVMGSDLIKIKNDLEGANKQNVSYKEVTEALAKAGIDASNASAIAEKLGAQKTQEDATAELKAMIKERDAKLEVFEVADRLRNVEAKLEPAFKSAIENFKDQEGNLIALLPDSLNEVKAELYKGIKAEDDEVIINNRINKALLQAKSNGDEMLKRNGLMKENSTTHQVGEQILTGQGQKSESPATAMQQLMNSGGNTTNSAAQAIMLASQANKQ